MTIDLEDRLRQLGDDIGQPEPGVSEAAAVRALGALPPRSRRRRPRGARLLLAAALLVPLGLAVAVVASRHPGRTATSPRPPGRTTAPDVGGSHPASAAELVGRWVEVEPAFRPEIVTFARGGRWSTTAGCTPESGRWSVERGAFRATVLAHPHPAGCTATWTLRTIARTARAEIHDGRLSLGPAILVRYRPLPVPPSAGWLPGYSAFTADRVVTDRAVLRRLAAYGVGIAAGAPTVAWRVGETGELGFDGRQTHVVYLVAYGGNALCAVLLTAHTKRASSSSCGSRYDVAARGADAVTELGRGFPGAEALAFVVADRVRSVTIEGGGEAITLPARDNYATGVVTSPMRRFTLELDDGQATTSTLSSQAPRLAFGGFVSPTGNIHCFGNSEPAVAPYTFASLRCEIVRHAWAGPPGSCGAQRTAIISMGAADVPGWTCPGDSVPTPRVLPYGGTWRVGPFRCLMASSGLTCRNGAGRGWVLSRERADLLGPG